MISASTHQQTPYFSDPDVANAVCGAIERECDRFGWSLKRYIVMPDHYHFVARSRFGKDLPAIVKRLHGSLSAFIRKRLAGDRRTGDKQSAKPPARERQRFFNNYWDTCLNSESEWLSALEYVRTNPVSAGLVEEPEEWELWGPKSANGLRQ